MPWAKLDDGYLTHPKVLKAGLEGRALHIAAILYSSRELTDGEIEPGILPGLGGLAGVKNAAKTAELLVGIRLFDRTESGYRIHDYLDYNPSRAAVLAEREAKREAGRKGANNRWHGNSKAEPIAAPIAPAIAAPIANGWQNDAPVPHTPSVSKETESAARPLPLPRKTNPTEEWLADMREQYGPHLRDFDETLEFHMNGSYYRGCRDKCGFLEKKLKAAAEREAAAFAPSKAEPAFDFVN